MEQVKYKLFEAVSRTLSVEEFAAWLYSDSYVNDHILDNDFIFELLSIDFSSNWARGELVSFCFKHFDKEEILVAVIENNCVVFNEKSDISRANILLDNICAFHDYHDDYNLMEQFYWLRDEMSLVQEGYANLHDVMKKLIALVTTVLQRLSDQSAEQRREYLEKGKTDKDLIFSDQHTIPERSKMKKKWFQFWKN